MDKGKQFEHAVCQAAWNMAGVSNLDATKQREYNSNQSLISKGTITSDIVAAGINAVNSINAKLSNVDWKSTRQLGGTRPEPKTDVIIGRNIKMSLKWEDDGYQLSSGNPRFTTQNLKNSLGVMYEQGDYSLTDYKKISKLIDEYGKAFSDVGIRPSTQIDSVLNRNQKLIGSLGVILASNQSAGDIYAHFNRAIVHEALTGEQLFGENSDKTANYVLGNLSGFHKINKAYVNAVAKYFKVRIAARKGRSTPEGAVERNQELSGRFELTKVGAGNLIGELARLH